MKLTKNKIETKILGDHFENTFCVATTSTKLDIHKLIKKNKLSVLGILTKNFHIFFNQYKYIVLINVSSMKVALTSSKNNTDPIHCIELMKRYVNYVRRSINFCWPMKPRKSEKVGRCSVIESRICNVAT